MNWQPRAGRLADAAARRSSRWHPVVASLPRHLFVPRWWRDIEPSGRWELRDGAADELLWLRAGYTDQSLVTRVAERHADHAEPGDTPSGIATSSATQPSLLLRMYRHARTREDCDILDVGVGSGYGTALLAARFGEDAVTGIDIDPYLVEAATERLASINLAPKLHVGDALDDLPGVYDRIIATVAMPGIPASWLAALRTGGRLVTTLARTSLIVTADKTPDGGAEGVTEWDRASFMTTRGHSPDDDGWDDAWRGADGDTIRMGVFPVVDVAEAWDLATALELTAPGVRCRYKESGGARTAWLWHRDGSWARATSHADRRMVTVHQAGPRALWGILDGIREQWMATGELPGRGARVRIDPDGTCQLTRGRWTATIEPASP